MLAGGEKSVATVLVKKRLTTPHNDELDQVGQHGAK
jgi:hypothetical protein